MGLDIVKDVAALQRMTPTELRARYAEVFGEETRSGNRDFLVRKIAWRIQAVAEGDLSERARRRALELANDADIRTRAPSTPLHAPVVQSGVCKDDRLPMPGTVLAREYKGKTIQVTVLPDGAFEYEGQAFRSLSAIAEAVTGTHWNGYHFFGLARNGKSA